jgi:hypothetical protein
MHWALGLKLGTWARARVPPDLDPEERNDLVLRELERGVGVSLEDAGGNRIRVGEIPELPDAIDEWLAKGSFIDVGLTNQDPSEGRPANLDKSEYSSLCSVRERPEDWGLSDPDKEPGTILSTRRSMQARVHALSDSYERLFLIIERLGLHMHPHPLASLPKTPLYKGALGVMWASSFSFLPLDPLGQFPVFGDWDTDEGVSEICSLRLEYLFCAVLNDFSSVDMLADILAWDLRDGQGVGVAWRNVWGVSLGPPDVAKRNEFKNAKMSVIIKTHKKPIEDRNVVRLFNNTFTAASQLLRRMLVQLLEEEIRAWEARGFVFPVLRNTRHYLKHLEELNDIWSEPYNPLDSYASGRRPPKPGEVLLDLKADVSKMYSNFSRSFVIETIDVFLSLRVLALAPR